MLMRLPRIVALLGGLLAAASANAAENGSSTEAEAPAPPPGMEHVRTVGDISEYRLTENGLRVLLLPGEGLPVASVMVTYLVGSRNEVPGRTGATHILEHMMFKGTDRYNPAKDNDYTSQMERIGARSNATTWFDRTNYFALLPGQYVPLAIKLEADRMRNLRIREEALATEKTVVLNEYERGENNPVQTLAKRLFATAFVAHPYGHPTIGWKSDIRNTTVSGLRDFYDTYYRPGNAVVSVIGGFDRSAALKAVVEHYGAIPAAEKPAPEVTIEEPEQFGPRRIEVRRSGRVGVVMIGYKVPEGTHEDWPALKILEQIVGADKTGRLYRALEDTGQASATSTFAPRLRDPGLFLFGAYLTPEATHEATEATILEEIRKVAENGVREDELERAKSVIRARTLYDRDGPYAIARQLNEAIAMGDWTSYLSLPEDIADVTADEIRRVASEYFVERHKTTGWFVPEQPKEAVSVPAAGGAAPGGPVNYRRPDAALPTWAKSAAVAASAKGDASPAPENDAELPEPGRAEVDFSESMRTATVAGIELTAIDMPITEVVSFVGSLPAGAALAPDAPARAALTAAMLDKGTATRDRFAIAESLDRMGADIGFSAGAHTVSFSGNFLRPDAGHVMELLADQLRRPAFPPEVLETLKSRRTTGLLQAMENPDFRAENKLRRMLYPEGHPNYAHPAETLIESIGTTTAENLAAFHEAHYGPAAMRLVFAGDIDFEQLKAAVGSAFDGWSGGAEYPGDWPGARANESRTETIPIEDKTSVSVRMGLHTGLQRTDKDYLPFRVGNYILGGSFESRLMSEVRKERGLTYDIRSRHSGDILAPGHWSLSASFAPARLERGLAATRSVLADWAADGVESGEVDAAQRTLSGKYVVGLSTTGRVAGQVHSFLQRGFDADYIDRYTDDLGKVRADAVNRAIRDYFDPSRLALVTAGSLPGGGNAENAEGGMPISVRLDVPHAGWRIGIERVYRTPDAWVAVSRLSESGGPAAQVVSTVSDRVIVEASGNDRSIRHYVIGKTWKWGNGGSHTFVDSMADVPTDGTLVYDQPADR